MQLPPSYGHPFSSALYFNPLSHFTAILCSIICIYRYVDKSTLLIRDRSQIKFTSYLSIDIYVCIT